MCPNIVKAKQFIDTEDVEALRSLLKTDPSIIEQTLNEKVWVLLVDFTSLYKEYYKVFWRKQEEPTEYTGNVPANIERDITLADYACIKSSPDCFELLLEYGCEASIYSLQHIGRMIEVVAPIKSKKYANAVKCLMALLVTYGDIQKVRQDDDLSVDGVTFSSVFPYGSTHENDDEWRLNLNKDDEPRDDIMILYTKIMIDHGAKQDDAKQGPLMSCKNEYLENYIDKCHSFMYSKAKRHLLMSPPQPKYATVTKETRANIESIFKSLMH